MDLRARSLPLVPPEAAPADDDRWYMDAIIYQLHVKAFHDSNDDGSHQRPTGLNRTAVIRQIFWFSRRPRRFRLRLARIIDYTQ